MIFLLSKGAKEMPPADEKVKNELEKGQEENGENWRVGRCRRRSKGGGGRE